MPDTGATLPPDAAPASGHVGDITLAQAKALIETANTRHDLQISFFTTPKPDPKDLEFWRMVSRWLRDAGSAIAAVFKPLGPAAPYIIWGVVIVLVLLLLSPVVRLFLTTRIERLFQRDHLKADAPWRPTREAVAALLEEIDALAEKGEYDEAVHLLLMRSVADINAYRPDLVRPHYSARDICTHPLLPEMARPAFRRIVGWVEKSFFAGEPVGKAGFDACRAAYVDFVSAEGLA